MPMKMRISEAQAVSNQFLDTIGPLFNCYRTVEELYAYGAALAAYYPTLAEWIDEVTLGRV